jgi:hypothetical protein
MLGIGLVPLFPGRLFLSAHGREEGIISLFTILPINTKPQLNKHEKNVLHLLLGIEKNKFIIKPLSNYFVLIPQQPLHMKRQSTLPTIPNEKSTKIKTLRAILNKWLRGIILNHQLPLHLQPPHRVSKPRHDEPSLSNMEFLPTPHRAGRNQFYSLTSSISYKGHQLSKTGEAGD